MRELGNLRFLIEQQLRNIDDLDRRGVDAGAARELLDRLMRRHEQVRRDEGAPDRGGGSGRGGAPGGRRAFADLYLPA